MDGFKGSVLENKMEIKEMIKELERELEKIEDKKNKILISIESLKNLEPKEYNEKVKSVVRNYLRKPNERNTKISLKTRKNQKFTDKQELKICKMYEKGYTLKEIKEKFSVSADPQIYLVLRRHNITLGRKMGRRKNLTENSGSDKEEIQNENKNGRKRKCYKWKQEVIDFLRENVNDMTNKELAENITKKFNFTTTSATVSSYLQRNKIFRNKSTSEVAREAYYKKHPEKLEGITEKQKELILKNRNLPIYLIESKLIEKFGSRIPSDKIKKILGITKPLTKRHVIQEEEMDEKADITLEDLEEINGK